MLCHPRLPYDKIKFCCVSNPEIAGKRSLLILELPIQGNHPIEGERHAKHLELLGWDLEDELVQLRPSNNIFRYPLCIRARIPFTTDGEPDTLTSAAASAS